MRQGWPAALKPGHIVRFSIGLEAVADLQLDLAQALSAAFG
jgi:cystathionine beta-lyase